MKHRMENNQNGNGKNKSSTHIYTNKKPNWIKWTNLCRSKISLWENQGSLKEHEQKSKPGWEIWLETRIKKKTTKTDSND